MGSFFIKLTVYTLYTVKAVYTLLTCLNNLTDIVLKTHKAEQTMLEVKYKLK